MRQVLQTTKGCSINQSYLTQQDWRYRIPRYVGSAEGLLMQNFKSLAESKVKSPE